jgi:hypothetical protein
MQPDNEVAKRELVKYVISALVALSGCSSHLTDLNSSSPVSLPRRSQQRQGWLTLGRPKQALRVSLSEENHDTKTIYTTRKR